MYFLHTVFLHAFLHTVLFIRSTFYIQYFLYVVLFAHFLLSLLKGRGWSVVWHRFLREGLCLTPLKKGVSLVSRRFLREGRCLTPLKRGLSLVWHRFLREGRCLTPLKKELSLVRRVSQGKDVTLEIICIVMWVKFSSFSTHQDTFSIWEYFIPCF